MRILALSIAMVVAAAVPVQAATLTVGVVSSSLKVREADTPATTPSAMLRAARNEFEAFQVVLAAPADVTGVSAKLSGVLTGPGGATIPAANVTLYAERYYNVGTPSNDEGAAGNWPDPLVPDVDTYVGEQRNAFPLTVPAGKTRVIWVDILVPMTAAPGDYHGEVEIDVGGAKQAAVPIALHVGSFALPSTSTLGTAYGFSFGTAVQQHCSGPYPFCATEDAANAVRALYLRAGLDHRFTLGEDFQPPFGSSQAPFEKYVLPLIAGSGPTRLPGAKLTTVLLDGSDSTAAQWISYAKSKGFFDRLFYYPVDEPNSDGAAWTSFKAHAMALHAADAAAQICLTTSIQNAQTFTAENAIDIFVPVLDEMYGRPGSNLPGDQRSKYDAWLAGKTGRKLWMYQSCDQHGCGSCGTPSHGADYTGWPQRVIDSTAVQDRAFAWVAWQEKVTAELYFATDYQLATAWDPNGQCAFSGSGDGTLFYPGKPSIIGGTTGIPIESIRMKMIREGMEDFEYLTLVERSNPTLARSVALALFPTPYQTHQDPAALESARTQLFAALDVPVAPTSDGGTTMGDGGAAGDGGTSGGGGGGCGCRTGAGRGGPAGGWLVAGLLGLFWRRRRRGQAG